MSDAISKHVVQNFNSDMASRLGLPDGLVRINVIFKINKSSILLKSNIIIIQHIY